MTAARLAPVSEYVLKVHSRCDLACDHCYVYEHADQSWRRKPRAISQATANLAARRIAEHAAAHRLARVSVIMHGGEPLLLGSGRMRQVLATLTSVITPVAEIDLRVHSNGVLLDERWCRLFSEYDVKVGISLDGNQDANDRHRRFRDGRSSHSQVLRALALLRRPEYRHLYGGILCTIDLANDPVMVYQALIAEAPPRLDLLLPHATWENPPYRPEGAVSPYADWLMRIYRQWTRDGRGVPIRLFGSLLSAIRGGLSRSEAIGSGPVNLLVIETDGTWEQPDSMKVAFDGAPQTGMRVSDHPVDEVVRHPAFLERQRGIAALCESCRACRVVRVCGGGLYAHRYRRGTGFDNPSVYCDDLKALISRVAAAEPAAAPGPRRVHELGGDAFDALAAGAGTVDAIRELAAMRESKAKSLVARVGALDRDWRDAGLRDVATIGWELLCALEADHPEAVREVITHPYTSVWAHRCLNPPAGADTDLDRAHLAGLAASVAWRAGITAELPLPARAGKLHLPTAGAVAVGHRPGRTGTVTIRPGRQVTAHSGGRWQEARYVTGPAFTRLAVEDLDPFRDCQEWPARGRLGPREWLAWRRALTAAGRRLAAEVPGYARVLGAGLRAVVPLRSVTAANRSSTAQQAFGAIAAALPGARGGLAELLLHEFQHAKLNALTDLYPLFDESCGLLLRVPWRQDRRPVGGVLHGAYAHLALAHLRRAEGAPSGREHLRLRSWVCEAAAQLTATRALTPAGDRFVAGMAAAAESGPG